MANYFEYLSRSPESLISRFYGCHSINMGAGDTLFIVVMENVLDNGMKIHEVYDIKGSWVARGGTATWERRKNVQSTELPCVTTEEEQQPILPRMSGLGKDNDLREHKRKLRIGREMKRHLLNVFATDSKFLETLNIMDYSLLLGFHFGPPPPIPNTDITQTSFGSGCQQTGSSLRAITSVDKGEVYCMGIIDLLQEWNFDKKLERFMKVYVFQKSKHGISATSPSLYSQRIITFLDSVTE